MADKSPKAGGAKKMHLHAITTEKLPDGTFAHHHIYKDGKDSDYHHPPRLMATSRTMQDVHDHLEDNLGGGAAAEPDADDQETAQAGDPNSPGPQVNPAQV